MPSRHDTVTDQMHEILDSLRDLVNKEIAQHGEIAADSQKVALMLSIHNLEMTIYGIEPFDLLALTPQDLERQGVDHVRKAYNNNARDSLVYRVDADHVDGGDVVGTHQCLVRLTAGDSVEHALSSLLGIPAEKIIVTTQTVIPFHSQAN